MTAVEKGLNARKVETRLSGTIYVGQVAKRRYIRSSPLVIDDIVSPPVFSSRRAAIITIAIGFRGLGERFWDS